MRNQLSRISANNAKVKYRVLSPSQKDERGAEKWTFSRAFWKLIPASSLLSSLFLPPKIITWLSKQLLPILPDHIPKRQLFLDSLHNHKLLREHLSSWMWSSAPSFFPFRAYCCPSGEVINGLIMYESVIPSVCCLVWIAHISSKFIPRMLPVRRDAKVVPPLGFSLTNHNPVYQDYVLQTHREDRRNPLILYKKESKGLKSW